MIYLEKPLGMLIYISCTILSLIHIKTTANGFWKPLLENLKKICKNQLCSVAYYHVFGRGLLHHYGGLWGK